MTTKMSKDEAHKLVDQLPVDSTWGDLMREIYIHEIIGKGLSDSHAGKIKHVSEIRKKHGLSE